jgi:hypothetical protein
MVHRLVQLQTNLRPWGYSFFAACILITILVKISPYYTIGKKGGTDCNPLSKELSGFLLRVFQSLIVLGYHA